MEFVAYGDLHFDKLDGLIPDVNAKIGKSIERVLDWSLDRGIEHAFQLGDVADKSRMGYESHLALLNVVSRKRYRGMSLHFLMGNHDFAENGVYSLQVLELVSKWLGSNIEVYTQPKKFNIQGVPFLALPHPFTETSKDRINLIHYEVKGSTMDSGRMFDGGPANKHVCLGGHLHTNHRVRNTHYCGTLFQTNFGESLPKFFHHVTATGPSPKDVEVENIKFEPPWKLLNLTVNSVSDLDQIENDPNTFYKLFMKDGLDLDINQVLVRHPNVVRHNTFKSKADLEVLTKRDWDFDTDVADAAAVDIDEREVVLEFLTSIGLKKSERRRAVEILERVTGAAPGKWS